MTPLGWGVGRQLLDDAHLDVPLEALLNLLLPVQGDPVGDGVAPDLIAGFSSGPVIPGRIWWGQVLNVEDL